jgi:Protein of unknown function DUF262
MRLIPSDPDLQTIVGRIRDGSLDLQPDFQRGAVWSRPKQQLLIDSILRNWYVPPVHLVHADDGSQVVLDGQQRLRAISEFTAGLFPVDGNTDPASAEIVDLDGLRYEELPEPVRRGFDRFTLRQFELVDYETEEPYELFFRLNQPTTLTAAEKRNAFFGDPRAQVKTLTESAQEAGMTRERLGFSNARLAYEDVVARFVWTLEVGTLGERVTATRITERYRDSAPFSTAVLHVAEASLSRLFGLQALDDPSVRLNKATAYSWLVFVARAHYLEEPLPELDEFLLRTEVTRSRLKNSDADHSGLAQGLLIAVLNDRATARVNDVASVLLRDAALWGLSALNETPPARGVPLLFANEAVMAKVPSRLEQSLLDISSREKWERLS